MNQIHPPLIYVLVLNYCSYDETAGCVKTLEKSDYANQKIIIIDNASPDQSGPRLREAFPHHAYLQSGKNMGYAGGNNLGIRYALEKNADFILIVNPDIRVAEKTISELVSALSQDKRRAAVMPLFLNPSSRDIDRGIKDGILDRVGFQGCAIQALQQNEWISSPQIFGACILFRSDALRKVGLFDPIYFCYYEEVDLCRRLRHYGYDVGIACRIEVVHNKTYDHPELDPIYYVRYYYSFRNSFVYILKDFNTYYLKTAYWASTHLMDKLASAIKRRDYRRVFFIIKIAVWLAAKTPQIIIRRRAEASAKNN